MGGRLTGAIGVALLAVLAAAAPASAFVPHTVEPGETLWSIAAASNFTTRALAAANGLPETAQVYTGQTVQIPSEGQAAAALGGTAPVASSAPSGTSPGPAPEGAYTVRWGDSLSAIAARAGVSVSQLAWMNGLDPKRFLLQGTPLKLPTGAPQSGQVTSSIPAVVPNSEPHPTNEFVTPQQVGAAASAQGVPPSLAAAVAKQESGYNNGLVSSANARGVMQILPGTWGYIRDSLATHPLNPSSAQDNVRAGSIYLGKLIRDGGSERIGTAAYYQGLSSVQRNGMLPETQRYVNNIMAIRAGLGF